MSYLDYLKQKVVGGLGKAGDSIGRAFNNPLPEFNLTEKAEAYGAPAIPQAERIIRVQNDPRFGQVLGTSSNQYYPNVAQVPDQPSYVAPKTSEYDELKTIADKGDLNPAQKTRWEELNANTGGSGDGGLSAQIALARGAYDNAVRGLRNAFGEARGIYDEGMGLLGKRRGEFQDIYDTGQNDILTSFEGERGNLQRSSVGNKARLRNILRATGMGGSAFVRGVGSQDKANLRNLGSLSNEKTINERENLADFNKRRDWADAQESALGRFLQAAQNRLQEGIGKAGLVQQGDVAGINSAFDNLRSNIYAQNAALRAAGGDIAGYQANPFAPNLSDMTNSLNVNLPTFNTAGGANEPVNQNLNNLSYLDLLKRRAGGSLYA